MKTKLFLGRIVVIPQTPRLSSDDAKEPPAKFLVSDKPCALFIGIT